MRLKNATVFGLLTSCVLLVGAACGGEQGGGGLETPETKTGQGATTAATLPEETTLEETSSLETEATEPITARAETAAGAPEAEEAREIVVKIAGLS